MTCKVPNVEQVYKISIHGSEHKERRGEEFYFANYQLSQSYQPRSGAAACWPLIGHGDVTKASDWSVRSAMSLVSARSVSEIITAA